MEMGICLDYYIKSFYIHIAMRISRHIIYANAFFKEKNKESNQNIVVSFHKTKKVVASLSQSLPERFQPNYFK